jgi:hypothetical protein
MKNNLHIYKISAATNMLNRLLKSLITSADSFTHSSINGTLLGHSSATNNTLPFFFCCMYEF